MDAVEMGKTVFTWTEIEMCGHYLLLDSLEVGRNQLKQAGAVHGLLMEVAGLESLTGSRLVTTVRRSCMRRAGMREKRKKGGQGSMMTLAHVKLLVKRFFRKPAVKVS